MIIKNNKEKMFLNKLSKVYHFIKRQYYTNFGFDRDLYLIYTMSKVGSSSVYYSLKKKFPYKEIHHIHFLGNTWLESFKSGHPIFNNNIKNADALFKLLDKRKWNIKIVSLVRDPIARDISGIFQTWEHLFDVKDVSSLTPIEIVEHFRTAEFSYSQNWFETDFKEFTGLNVFENSFDATKGYEIYFNSKASILILQLEQLNNIYNQALNEFIGFGYYKLQKENVTSSRASGELNAAVKKLLKFPRKKLEDIYQSPYIKTFYNESQVDKFVNRWAEK